MSQVHLTEVKPPTTHRSWMAALAAGAVVVVVVAGGAALLGRNNNSQSSGVVAPVTTATTQPTERPTLAPTVAPTPAAPSAASACVVSTLAGKAGELGFADGAGSAVRFGEEAVGLVFGPDGLIYMPDRSNQVVRRMTPDGVVTTIAGKAGDARSVDGKGAEARFNRPTGGGFDAAGNLYVADTDSSTIRKIAPDGTVTTLAGKAGEAGEVDGKGSAARFTDPIVGAVDASGNVYVGTSSGTTIRKVAPDGTVTTLVGKAGESGRIDGDRTTARLSQPWSVALDPQGNLWVNDVDTGHTNSVLRKITSSGVVTTVKGSWVYGSPFGLWPAPSGALYYTAYRASTVAMLTPDGEEVLLAGEPYQKGAADGPGDAARFRSPTSILRDASGLIYVSESGNGTIRTIRCDSAFPTGTWSRPLASGGTGVYEFRPDGTYTYAIRGEGTSTGTYATEGGVLTFLTDSFCAEQNAERGTYRWTYSNDELTFNRLDDQCLVGRVTTLDGSVWTPVE